MRDVATGATLYPVYSDFSVARCAPNNRESVFAERNPGRSYSVGFRVKLSPRGSTIGPREVEGTYRARFIPANKVPPPAETGEGNSAEGRREAFRIGKGRERLAQATLSANADGEEGGGELNHSRLC